MDNNTILKLSNKNKLNIKKDDSPKLQVQTQLVDSMTQRINLEENQQPDLIPQSPANSNLNQSKSHNNSKSQEHSKSVENAANFQSQIPTPLSQSKINEIIQYNNNYGEPVIENNSINSNVNNNQTDPVINMNDNFGTVPLDIDCPFCNNQIQSHTDSKCNGCTVCLYILIIIIFPIMCVLSIYRAGTRTTNCFYCSSEEGCFNCCDDVKHTCPKCGKVIGESNSCSRLFPCLN